MSLLIGFVANMSPFAGAKGHPLVAEIQVGGNSEGVQRRGLKAQAAESAYAESTHEGHPLTVQCALDNSSIKCSFLAHTPISMRERDNTLLISSRHKAKRTKLNSRTKAGANQ